LAVLVRLVEDGALSGTNAKQVFMRHAEVRPGDRDRPSRDCADQRQGLSTAIEQVLAANPSALADVRAGKPQAFGFLTGQYEGDSGQANAATVQRLLREMLGG
jgi:aspartyl-tRNA(Asn)/glutamyl-tRNA(Gln) amidotransferase subunit B